MSGHFHDGERAGYGLNLERDLRRLRVGVWVALAVALAACAAVVLVVTR